MAPGVPGNTGGNRPVKHGRSSTDSMVIVIALETAPAGIKTPACPFAVTIVVFRSGCAVPSPQSEPSRSHSEPTPMKN